MSGARLALTAALELKERKARRALCASALARELASRWRLPIEWLGTPLLVRFATVRGLV